MNPEIFILVSGFISINLYSIYFSLAKKLIRDKKQVRKLAPK